MGQGTIDCDSVAATWFDNFRARLVEKNVQGVVDCFLPDGWLRDLLIFTWDHRSLHGHEKIRDHLSQHFTAVNFSEVHLEDDPHLKPELGPFSSVSSGFKFKTAHLIGRGYFTLVQVDEKAGLWKALVVHLSAKDIIGHEELGVDHTPFQGSNGIWPEVAAKRKCKVEEDPYALIIGAGQTGLNIAARFKQMNIPAVTIDKNVRIGGTWRQRHPSLFLHTTRSHHELLYQPYPKNWPMFTPRDKLADWLEHYAISQDLVVWMKSSIIDFAQYDQEKKKWTVRINRNGEEVTIQPAHIVVAIGTLGAPYIPPFPGRETFRGDIIHSADFKGAKPYVGKTVAVIGAGNSAADVCVDLYAEGAKTVTMVQKSSTCVVLGETVKEDLDRLWPEDNVPKETTDFKAMVMPFGLIRTLMISGRDEKFIKEKQLHKELNEVGFNTNLGLDGTGYFFMIIGRHGGYWVDFGCAKLITEKKVHIKSGVEIDHLTEKSIIFKDGSELEVDAIVSCTGFNRIDDSLRIFLPPDVVDNVGIICGLDEETELHGAYRPTGVPGLWFGVEDFAISRTYSKLLAIQIKARELGIIKSDGLCF